MTHLAPRSSTTMKAISLPPNAQPTSTGLTLVGISKEDHSTIGRFLGSVDSASQWWQGDWFNAIDAGYGEHEDVCRQAGLVYDTVRNYARVCAAIEYARRRAYLSFGHHEAVAVSSLEAEEQDILLDEAERHNWTIRELRNCVRRRLDVDDLSLASDDGGSPVLPAVDRTPAPTEDSVAVVVDGEGREVTHAKLRPVFEDLSQFDRMLQHLVEIKKNLKSLMEGPRGALLVKHHIIDQHGQLYHRIKSCKPHSVCPYCSGRKRQCQICNGAGWISQLEYNQRLAGERMVEK